MVRVNQQESTTCFTFEQYNILNNLTSFWQRYAMWSRALFISGQSKMPNEQTMIRKVYGLPLVFYEIIRVFYGQEMAQELMNIFQRYIIIKINVMYALMQNNQKAAQTYTEELYASGDKLAEYLAQQPYWVLERWKMLIYQDIRLSFEEYRSLLTGEHEMEIGIYERLLDNAGTIGSYMASGILQATSQPTPPMIT